jgi:hypothetical protein
LRLLLLSHLHPLQGVLQIQYRLLSLSLLRDKVPQTARCSLQAPGSSFPGPCPVLFKERRESRLRALSTLAFSALAPCFCLFVLTRRLRGMFPGANAGPLACGARLAELGKKRCDAVQLLPRQFAAHDAANAHQSIYRHPPHHAGCRPTHSVVRNFVTADN